MTLSMLKFFGKIVPSDTNIQPMPNSGCEDNLCVYTSSFPDKFGTEEALEILDQWSVVKDSSAT